MTPISLAARNLLRNRRRSAATFLALAIGAVASLCFGGYVANIKYSMQTAYVRSGGHLQIQHSDFFLYGSGNPTGFSLDNHEALTKAILGDSILRPMLEVVTPTLQFLGVAGNYEHNVSKTVIGVGYSADDVQRMRKWNEFNLGLVSPDFALVNTPLDTAVIGTGVARVLRMCDALKVQNCPSPTKVKPMEGDNLPADIAQLALDSSSGWKEGRRDTRDAPRIDLLASTVRGSPNVAALRVAAAEAQGFKELDESLVVLHLKQAQNLVFGRGEAKVTALMLQLKSSSQIPAATRRLRQILDSQPSGRTISILDFETLNPFYVQSVQLFNTIFGFIFALIAAIVLFTVGNTMSAAVVERTVEIGTLRSIGLRRIDVQSLFIFEGLIMGVLGAVGGLGFAVALSLIANSAGLTWLPPGSSEPLPLIVRVWGEWQMMIGTTLGLIVVAIVSAWVPARRAARLNIVEALRHA